MSFVRHLHRVVRLLVLLAAIGLLLLSGYALMRSRPQDLPFTPLDLGQPVGLFTGLKLAQLGEDGGKCRALLARAGVRFERVEPFGGPNCRVETPIRLLPGGSAPVRLEPAAATPACPVVAALTMWEWNVVQPAAREELGSPVVAIRHLGSYSCRRIYGRAAGEWSEHARANALDVAGFVLADGRVIGVANDWARSDGAGRFLRRVRDGGCRLFATVLSPDYNATHRDHLHLDEAARGGWGGRACR